jgi:hypothetical protein
MDVTWRIEPLGGGTRVTIDHEFRPRVAGWAALVDRLFTRPIAGRTLATLKVIAEAVDGAERAHATDTSADPAAANAST